LAKLLRCDAREHGSGVAALLVSHGSFYYLLKKGAIAGYVMCDFYNRHENASGF
jgi:hypothetical protein